MIDLLPWQRWLVSYFWTYNADRKLWKCFTIFLVFSFPVQRSYLKGDWKQIDLCLIKHKTWTYTLKFKQVWKILIQQSAVHCPANLNSFTFTRYWLYVCFAKKLPDIFSFPCLYWSIVPQLSKCLKFEAVWGVLTDQMIWIWTKRCNKTNMCIVVHRMEPHNQLIDWYYLLSYFVKLIGIESLKSFN